MLNIYSLLFSVMSFLFVLCYTFLGYGDILPSSITERLVAAAVGLIGLFIFNYIISQIYATLASKNAAR